MDEHEWLAERFGAFIRARSREITSANVFGNTGLDCVSAADPLRITGLTIEDAVNLVRGRQHPERAIMAAKVIGAAFEG